MKSYGGADTRSNNAGDDTGPLAMAGPVSPWGGGGKDGGDKDGGAGGSGPDDSGTGDEGDAGGTDHGERRGPRNPWLPSGDTPPPPRRASGLEDILRGRDPRRSGGGSGGPGLGGFPNLPRRPDGKSWLPLAIGAAVVVLLGASSVHMLGPKEQGVVTTLGKYSRTIDSGVSVTLPWPIEHVNVVDVSSFKLVTIPDDDNEKLMLTSDKSLVDLSYLVRWNVKDLKNYTFRLADPEQTVREVAEAAMRASIAQISLGQALSGAGRADVEQDVRERMQTILDFYHAGISVQGVEIKKADPPAKTKGAFDNVNVAQQEAERDRSEARAWAQQVLARAQGDASAFDKIYAEYKLAPEVTKRRLYYETMERVVRDNDTVVAETNGGTTTYLPLPEFKRRTAAAPDGTTITVPDTRTSTNTGGQQ